MGFGFELHESFSGTFYRLDDPMHDFAMTLKIRVSVDGIRDFLRDARATATGTLRADRLAIGDGTGQSVSGFVAMKLFQQKRIPYDLSFDGDDGKRYRLRGQRDFFVHDAIDSLTLLSAGIYDEAGAEVARATLRFDPKTELMPTLRSFRPRARLFGKKEGD